jgi:hypothetical protein
MYRAVQYKTLKQGAKAVVCMAECYSLSDALRSYRWLGHQGFTELNAWHPAYRPGRENYAWNREHDAFPRVAYARNELELVRFLEAYAGKRMCCFGLNPRPSAFRNERGYYRSAKESEILVSQNLLLDVDTKDHSPPQPADESFLDKTKEYFLDLGLLPPVRACTGRGHHLLFAYEVITVAACPDIAARLGMFREGFTSAYRRELDHHGLKCDATQDLTRALRVYGSAKPTVGILSRFPDVERCEDENLREYLLNLTVPLAPAAGIALNTGASLPSWFNDLLHQDNILRNLWDGTGKPEGTDQSRSGFDYSITRRLLRQGFRNIDDLATILTLRPDGAVQGSKKNQEYVRRTISNALNK